MSQSPINLSDDLKRLRDEGYDIEIKAGYLLLKDVPYVNTQRQVRRGILVSALDLAGEVTVRPGTHVIHFAGEYPCRVDGSEIAEIKSQSQYQTLADGLVIDHTFSSKPPEGYRDYYHKMTTYTAIIVSHAQAINPDATAKTFPIIEAAQSESVFRYTDTASSRAGISQVNRRLELGKVAIVGLGGTGAYVLDLVAKTPVREIHLFDGDILLQHNAFRSPGAPSLEALRAKPSKVGYLANLYGQMRRGIVTHEQFLDAANLHQLDGMDFVFLCLDKGHVKQAVVARLEACGIAFVDVGMGLYLVDDQLGGTLRVTSSDNRQREHVRANLRIPFADGDEDDPYNTNIQVADLNALNAALAVIRWKRLFGFYLDLEGEYHSTYAISGNSVLNEDHA